MAFDRDPVRLDCVECIKTTDDALLVYVPDLGDEVWIPRSQVIEDDSDDLEEGETGLLVITRWIAGKKGLV